MKFIVRHAWREIRNSRSFCFFYSLNLALGLMGFVVVDAFRESIESKVTSESRELLGADLALRARRSFTTLELEKPVPPCPPILVKQKRWIFSRWPPDQLGAAGW